jgi:glycerol-3-phosphate dehydrogenase
MVTVCGGKWTTYRRMAEDCVDQAAVLARLPDRPCGTAQLRIHGFHTHASDFGALSVYGADADRVRALRQDPALAEPLHAALPYTGAEVIWAVRHEMARTVEDVLARRTRALFLNARAAREMAPLVAGLLARELRRDERWRDEQVSSFYNVARNYLVA